MMSPETLSRSIVVIRHGETDWNAARRIQGRTEVPLNATGRVQAAQAAQLLLETGPWREVIASPLGRAVETATIISDALGLAAPGIDAEILERDFGEAEGVHVPEAHERWPGLEVPGAESLAALAHRGAGAFSRILREKPGSVVVAHGALMRAALGTLAGREMPRVINGELWLIEQTPTGPTRCERVTGRAARQELRAQSVR